MKELIISSSMFMNNGWMPDECSGYGNDISPDIRVEDIPDGTQTLAIILDDLDHPVFREFNHWIAWNIPCVNLIPEALPGGIRQLRGLRQVRERRSRGLRARRQGFRDGKVRQAAHG